MLDKKTETIERLGACPLPIRIEIPVSLSEKQIANLDLGKIEGRPIFHIEKDSEFEMYVFEDKTTGEKHVAVIKGNDRENVPIRIHSSCLTAESFHALNCDCHEQLQMALLIADKEGFGGVIWLHQEGRGNGLAAKVKQIKIIMEEGLGTVDAFEKAGYPKDQRDYTSAAGMLKNLGIKSIRLITNNPDRLRQIEKLGIRVLGRIPCEIAPTNELVRKDLKEKRDKLGHRLLSDNL